MRDFFGTDEVPFTVTATGLPPDVTRSFTSLSAAADEAASARVYGGIHFRTGCEAAVRLGEHVGQYVFETQLRAAVAEAGDAEPSERSLAHSGLTSQMTQDRTEGRVRPDGTNLILVRCRSA